MAHRCDDCTAPVDGIATWPSGLVAATTRIHTTETTDMNVEIPQWAMEDPEWASALHLLTSPLLVRKGVMEHVDFARCHINVPRLLRVSVAWSSGERAMLRAACDLFNSGGKVGLSELLWSVDDGNLQRVLEAIEMRRRWRRWGEGGAVASTGNRP
jgi:hypothetical protein